MKKLILFMCAAFSASVGFSQNLLQPTGSVGIGTLNPESGFLLDVNGFGTIGTQNNARIYLGTSEANAAFIQSRNHITNQGLKFYASTFSFNIGNVGIGTTDPGTRKVKIITSNATNDVAAEISNSRVLGNNYGLITTAIGVGADLNTGLFTSATGGTSNLGLRVYNVQEASNSYAIYSDSPAQSYLQGNVGIGTLTPKEKLSVNGKIRAQEIKVETTNWPDYVFSKSHQLPSLQETEKHIKEKGHLPGIPSAEEVKANGIDLGEMNAKQLQKIEELTLHLIEIKKQSDQQNAQQAKEIEYLKSKIK